jgi:type I restriction enzyme S subunit
VLRAGNLQDGHIVWEDLVYVPEQLVSDAQRLRRGDIVVAMSSGSASVVGKAAPVLECDTDRTAGFGAFCGLWRTATPEWAPWLQQYFQSAEYRQTVSAAALGVNINNLRADHIGSLEIPVPPLNEQRRIVAKLESLQSRSHRAREALDAVPALIEKLRQSTLAAAFRGDLTKDWRAKHKDVEPASELLKRIRVERRKKREEGELAKMTAKGRGPTDDRWKARYREPEPVDATGLPELPEGWCWASMDELLTGLRNGVSTKPDKDTGLRILRISAVRSLRVDVDDVRFLGPSGDYEDYILADGELLLTRYNGNPELVGVAGVVRGLQQATVYPDKLIRATPVEAVISADFLALALNTGATRRHIASKGKTAAGQIGVSGSDIKGAPVPVPPLGEQVSLVMAVNGHLQSVHAVKAKATAITKSFSQLQAATLAKAFRGELVPQDPNDEPAEAMLARARAINDRGVEIPITKRRGQAAREARGEPRTPRR